MKKRIKGCVWAIEIEGMTDEKVWHTSCGNGQLFAEGGVADNEYKYCPYCGKKIKEKPQGTKS